MNVNILAFHSEIVHVQLKFAHGCVICYVIQHEERVKHGVIQTDLVSYVTSWLIDNMADILLRKSNLLGGQEISDTKNP